MDYEQTLSLIFWICSGGFIIIFSFIGAAYWFINNVVMRTQSWLPTDDDGNPIPAASQKAFVDLKNQLESTQSTLGNITTLYEQEKISRQSAEAEVKKKDQALTLIQNELRDLKRDLNLSRIEIEGLRKTVEVMDKYLKVVEKIAERPITIYVYPLEKNEKQESVKYEASDDVSDDREKPEKNIIKV